MGKERLWNTSNTKAIDAVQPYLIKGINLLHVYKIDTGRKNADFFAEKVDNSDGVGNQNNKSSSSATTTTNISSSSKSKKKKKLKVRTK